MKTRFAGLALAVAALGSGCSRSERAPATTAETQAKAPSAEKTKGATTDDVARLRALALADSKGTTKLDQSILSYRRIAEKNPNKVENWVLLGRAWVAKARSAADPGYYTHADACADLALRLHPDDRMALGLRTLVLLNNHKFEAARIAAEAITKTYPDDALAYGSLSDTLLEVGRVEEATNAATTMLHLKPNLPSYGRASYLAWLHGDTKGAIRFARLAIDSGKDGRDLEPWAWQMTETAMIFWHQGDYEGALAGFEQVNELYGVYAPALSGKGRTLLSMGKATDAIGYLMTAVESAPLIDTQALLCDAFEAAGKNDEATNACARAETEGERTDARGLSTFYTTRSQKPERALLLAKEEMGERPGIYSRDAYSWALYRNGRIKEAKAESDAAMAYGTKDARLMYHAGAIRIASGDVKGGKKLVEEALALNSGFDLHGAKEARTLVGKQ